ncbi:MAG: hypothetical protein FWC42_06310 [Proteobacteria bacterium]|nr:hypothetical protein [Pseudomonadota bacterium]
MLDQVALGEEFLITRHGKAVAHLAPIKPAFDRAKARQAAQCYWRRARVSHSAACPLKNGLTKGGHDFCCR